MLELLSSIPPTVTVAVLTAIITSAATLSGVWLSNRASERRLEVQLRQDRTIKNEEYLRVRLEELYVHASKYCKTLSTHFLHMTWATSGKISFDQLMKLDMSDDKAQLADLHRLEMLLNVYFPSQRHAYDDLIRSRNLTNSIWSKCEPIIKSGQLPSDEIRKTLADSIIDLDRVGVSFRESIASISGALTPL